MGSEGCPCGTLSIKPLLVLLALHLSSAQNPEDSSIVNITECSVQHLTFTLTETLNINSRYWFLAACKDNGTCVDGDSELGRAIEPTVGSTVRVSMGPSCTLSKLSASGTGLCTLLISSSNVVWDTTGTFSTVCTLPVSSPVVVSSTSVYTSGTFSTVYTLLVSSPVVSSTSVYTSGSFPIGSKSEVAPSPTVAVGSLSPPVLGAVIAVPLLILLTGLIVATVSLLIWKRHSRVKSYTGRAMFVTCTEHTVQVNSIFQDMEDLDSQFASPK